MFSFSYSGAKAEKKLDQERLPQKEWVDFSALDPFALAVADLSTQQNLFHQKSAWDDLFGKEFMREIFSQHDFNAEKAAKLFSGDIDALLGQIEMWMWRLTKHDGRLINPDKKPTDQLSMLEEFDLEREGCKLPNEDYISQIAHLDMIFILGRALDAVKIINPKIHDEFIKVFPVYNNFFNRVDKGRLCQGYQFKR